MSDETKVAWLFGFLIGVGFTLVLWTPVGFDLPVGR